MKFKVKELLVAISIDCDGEVDCTKIEPGEILTLKGKDGSGFVQFLRADGTTLVELLYGDTIQRMELISE